MLKNTSKTTQKIIIDIIKTCIKHIFDKKIYFIFLTLNRKKTLRFLKTKFEL